MLVKPPHAEGVDKGIVGVDIEDVNEAPRAEVLARQVIVVAEDIDKDTLSMMTSEMMVRPLAWKCCHG
jgi:4'-phosphopantetheinyl transferase EntD